MISQELIRRYPFFVDLSASQIAVMAKVANRIDVEAGHWFHYEGDELKNFYIIEKGQVTVIIGVPNRKNEALHNYLANEDVRICSIEAGEMFGWSALVPPNKATAGAKATTDASVLVFDCEKLQPHFDQDPELAFRVVLKAAQTIRDRLRCLRMETLAYLAA